LGNGKLIPEEFDGLSFVADSDAVPAAYGLVILLKDFIQLHTDPVFPVIIASLIAVHF
jgi:hypothetical protein